VASNGRIVLSLDGSTRTRFKQAFRVANYQSQARPIVTASIEPGAGLTIRDATVVEGASGGTTAPFEVELSGE
jgi:hypothetical protein